MQKRKRKDLAKKMMAYSAAAAGVLAMSPAAEAAIVYSGIRNIDLGPGQTSYNVDLDGNATTDFTFVADTSGGVGTGVALNAAAGNYFIESSYFVDPVPLPAGYLIQNTLANPAYGWDNESNDTLVSTVTTSTSGMFNNRRGYIGVQFNAACGTAYGWIQFEGTAVPGVSAVGRIIDWAYEDTCQPIQAGAGALGAPTPVPTVGEWGAIGMAGLLGAAALNRLRKREQE